MKCKKWKDTGDPLDFEAYKLERKSAQRIIAKAKNTAMDDLYQRLKTKEGHKKVYIIAKRREKLTKDVMHVRMIKDESWRLDE